MTRRNIWIISNGLFGVALYVSAFERIEWLSYVVVAFTWFMLISYLSALFSKEALAKFRERPRPVPAWIGYLLDVTFISTLLFAGWYVTAGAYAASCVCFVLAHSGRGISRFFEIPMLRKVLILIGTTHQRWKLARMLRQRGDYPLFSDIEKLLKTFVRSNNDDIQCLMQKDLMIGLGRQRKSIGNRRQFVEKAGQNEFLIVVPFSEVPDIAQASRLDDGSTIPKDLNSALVQGVSLFLVEHIRTKLGPNYTTVIGLLRS